MVITLSGVAVLGGDPMHVIPCKCALCFAQPGTPVDRIVFQSMLSLHTNAACVAGPDDGIFS